MMEYKKWLHNSHSGIPFKRKWNSKRDKDLEAQTDPILEDEDVTEILRKG